MKKYSKKKKTTLVVIILVFELLVKATLGGTLTPEYVIKHILIPGSLDITATEPSWDEEEGDGQNMYPGYHTTMDPTIENVTDGENSAAYVRAIMTFKDTETGEKITNLEQIELIEQTIRYDANDSFPEGESNGYSSSQVAAMAMYNTKDWEIDYAQTRKAGAGVYVYNYRGKMDSGEKSVLYNHILIPDNWSHSQMEKLGNFEIQIDTKASRSMFLDDRLEAVAAMAKTVRAATFDFLKCYKAILIPGGIILAGAILASLISQREKGNGKCRDDRKREENISIMEENADFDRAVSGKPILQEKSCHFPDSNVYEPEIGTQIANEQGMEIEIKEDKGRDGGMFTEQGKAA